MTDKEKPCKFCEAMKVRQQIDKFTNEHRSPEDLKKYGEYKTECTVAIVTHTWNSKTGKKNAGRMADYRHMGLGYKLNYCPECGRKIRGEEDASNKNNGNG